MRSLLKKYWFSLAFLIVILAASFIRIVNLSGLPPSPYWEEVALGYDAYSILETGRDHHGNLLPILAFESFGDWKPSLYFYSIVPFIRVFGLSLTAVRLPSALSGILIVIGLGFLAKQLVAGSVTTKRTSFDLQLVQLVAMSITAISPWAIMFSRAGWEVNLATALILWGVLIFLFSLKSLNSRTLWLRVVSVILLGLSAYTYHAARLISPLLLVALFAIGVTYNLREKSRLKRQVKTLSKNVLNLNVLLPGLLFVLILLPILLNLTDPSVSNRFKTTSIFTDLSVIEESNDLKDRANNTLLARLVYHRYGLFGREILINITEHLDLSFLFIHGDSNPRHSTGFYGLLYHIEFIFLLTGLYWFARYRRLELAFLLWWLLIGILPSALAVGSPHALRILPTLPVWLVLITAGILFGAFSLTEKASGLVARLNRVKPSRVVLATLLFSFVSMLYFLEFMGFWRFYTRVYPQLYSSQWQYGYQQMVESVNRAQKENPETPIFISRELGRPAMYYWFYSQTDPRLVQDQERIVEKDNSEFLQFDNITFFTNLPTVTKDAIFALPVSVLSSSALSQHAYTTLDVIYSPSGEPIWQVILAESK